jgi:hypothetical protein
MDSERIFTFAIHDLLELIECGEVDGSMVVSTLNRRLRKPDPWLDIADSVIAAKKTEEKYFNVKN